MAKRWNKGIGEMKGKNDPRPTRAKRLGSAKENRTAKNK